MDQWEGNLFLYSWETYIYGVILLYSIYRELFADLQHTHMEGMAKATMYSTFEISHEHHFSYPNDFKSTLYKLFCNNELLIKRLASYDFDRRKRVTLLNLFELATYCVHIYQRVVKLLQRTRLSRRLIILIL